MTYPDFMISLFTVAQVLWVFAIGASVGSLINVLVYRLPLGLSVVTPPSRCPCCETRLTWRENIPILGWVLLGGRCRFCRSKISIEYPAVELFVAVLFALFFVLWYHVEPNARLVGVNIGQMAPDWAGPSRGIMIPLVQTWPTFLVTLVLLGCLVAMTLVDAKTFTIPLVLAWVPSLVALVAHPLHALYVQATTGRLWRAAEGWTWTIPSPGPQAWYWVGFPIGGVIGLGVSLLLLRSGLITRSFADYEEWEKQQRAAEDVASPHALRESSESVEPAASEIGVENGPLSQPLASDPATADAALLPTADQQAEMWIQYPHARREMIKELAFLASPVVLALIGGWLANLFVGRVAGWQWDPRLETLTTTAHVPLWLSALSGVLLGYLVGGAVVWFVRIFGSLAFGKEAMGLGDVHLMAAVGACLGWIDATIAFFLAAFVGLAWALGGALFGGLRRQLPYGPHLAVASVLVLLLKPWIETGLRAVLHTPVDLP
ncbi:MAG TPA: prepilin peptidase [Phycisphaerales bacterium]